MQSQVTLSKSRIFQDIEFNCFDTSAGPCDLPIVYNDGSFLAVGYRVDVERVRSQMGITPLEVMPLLGKALVVLSIFEYRETAIGAYNEIGLSVYTKRIGTRPSQLNVLRRWDVKDAGMHVFNLPVNSPLACAAGVDLWNYPKYISDITTKFRNDRVEVRLGQEFSITHRRSRFALDRPGVPFVSFSVHHNRLLRTTTEVDYRVRLDLGNTIQLNLLGEGPTATTIKALGLDQLRPAFAFRTDEVKSIVSAGKDVGAV